MKRMNFPSRKKARREGAVERLEKSINLIGIKEKKKRVEEIIENTKKNI